MTRLRRSSIVGLATVVLLASHLVAPFAAGHEGISVGPYTVEVGWGTEPPVIGQANTVTVSIEADGEPVADLAAGDLAVVVSTAGQDGSRLDLAPAFGAGTAGRPAGTYEAPYVPTAAGAYTFRVTGTIHATPVDLTAEGDVTVDDEAPAPGPDPLLLVGGAVLIVLLAGMGFLFFRVRPARDPRS